MDLSGLKRAIKDGRYDVPGDRVASALLKKMSALRALRSAGYEPGATLEAETRTGEDVSPRPSD